MSSPVTASSDYRVRWLMSEDRRMLGRAIRAVRKALSDGDLWYIVAQVLTEQTIAARRLAVVPSYFAGWVQPQ